MVVLRPTRLTSCSMLLSSLALMPACGDESSGGAAATEGADTAVESGTGPASETTADDANVDGSSTAVDTEEGSTSADETSGTTGDSPAECQTPMVQCPDDLPVLGLAGQTTVEAIELPLQASEACGALLSELVYVRVPDDIVSVGVSVESGESWSGLSLLQLEDDVLIDANVRGPTGWGAAPTKHVPGVVASTVLPMSPQSQPSPGCLAVQVTVEGQQQTDATLRFVTRRTLGEGRLDLNLVIVEGTDVESEELSAAVAVVEQLYTDGSAALLDTVGLDSVAAPSPFVPTEGPELEALRASYEPESAGAMTVYLIADFLGEDGGVLGIAAGVPGPNGVAGTRASGVVVAIEPHRFEDGQISTQLLGETIAHELGHQFGLFHTSESDGSANDLAPDTAECGPEDDIDGDASLVPSECPDGSNFMFWTSDGTPQTEVSPFQADVIFFSPVVY